MTSQQAVLGVTAGDPAGIGPEITAMTLTNPTVRALARAVVYADPSIMERAVRVSGVDATINIVTDPAESGNDPRVIDVADIGVIRDADAIAWGAVQEPAGRAALASIERAVADAIAGNTAGIVTSPIHKEAVWATGCTFLGHTELLQDLTAAPYTDTMFVVGDLCVFFATRHMSLRRALDAITGERVEEGIRRALLALRVFGCEAPRLAVAALNPHGGENGHFGTEEIEHIAPAIRRVAAEGFSVDGPIPADAVFHLGLQGRYDGVLSLYHDQGHIATKTYDFDNTVSVTIGLPILRTSVDHGTAFDIAGTGKASPRTMEAAFAAGARLMRHNESIRQHYGSMPAAGN